MLPENLQLSAPLTTAVGIRFPKDSSMPLSEAYSARVSVGGLTGHATAEDLDATGDRAWSVIPSQVALVPLPSGLATAVAWRF